MVPQVVKAEVLVAGEDSGMFLTQTLHSAFTRLDSFFEVL
jgi:hypothetical protein